MAVHNDPDLSILQVGHSDTLVNSLLSILGAAPGKTMRCSRYTILDPDSDRINLCKDEFHQWSDNVSFGTLEVQTLGDDPTWMEKPLDIVIVISGLIAVEQVQLLKTYLRPDGIMIIQKPSPDDLDW